MKKSSKKAKFTPVAIMPPRYAAIDARLKIALPCMRQLALAGRHSLAIYLLHQPLLLGILFLVALL